MLKLSKIKLKDLRNKMRIIHVTFMMIFLVLQPPTELVRHTTFNQTLLYKKRKIVTKNISDSTKT